MPPCPQPDFGFVAVGEISVVEKPNFFKTLAPQQDKSPVGKDNIFDRARFSRFDIDQSRTSNGGKLRKMCNPKLGARDSDSRIALQAFE
jgi:hypothetical protein